VRESAHDVDVAAHHHTSCTGPCAFHVSYSVPDLFADVERLYNVRSPAAYGARMIKTEREDDRTERR
jgi:hypothetical protein